MSKKLEDLLAQRETISNEALKRALDGHIKIEQERQEKELLNQFQEAQRILDEQIARVRRIREQEKIALKALKRVNAAFEEFKENGDWNKFQKNLMSK